MNTLDDSPDNDFDLYQIEARKTAVYKRWKNREYPFLGLAGETGEVCEVMKKQIRDKESDFDDETFKHRLSEELGDVLWYIANICTDMDLSLAEIADNNLKKLSDRRKRNVIHGEGDNR